MKDFWAWEDFKTMKRIRLGDALVDKGLITQEQLQEALTKENSPVSELEVFWLRCHWLLNKRLFAY